MRHPLIPGACLALVGAVALWGCGGGASTYTPTAPTASSAPAPAPAPAPSAPTTPSVIVSVVGSVGNAAYQPNPVKANAGDVVAFRNTDSTLHHIVVDNGSDLGDIAPGATSRGFTVQSASAVNFHCTIHTSMVGSINGAVAPTPDPGKCYDSYGQPC